MSDLLFYGHPNVITGTGNATLDNLTAFGTGSFFPIFEIEDAIIPAYAYQEYADDDNIQAFFVSYNTLAQLYLDWFNQSSFGVYTLPGVSGPLLDWVGNGLYGIPRPVFSTLASGVKTTALGTYPLNSLAIATSRHSISGTAFPANDDYYKRTLTWYTYLGDGRQFSATNLRKRVARFLYGQNGSDVTVTQTESVSVAVTAGPPPGFLITVPPSAGAAASYFQQAVNSGILTFPFQMNITVSIGVVPPLPPFEGTWFMADVPNRKARYNPNGWGFYRRSQP